MIKRSGRERRQYPRIDQELPVKIAANGYDFATTTQNISCVGTYCRIDKYVPPFTRIAVKMELPCVSDNCSIECKGVIVRTEDEEDGKGFNVAIFFNGINATQKEKITQYINQFLPK